MNNPKIIPYRLLALLLCALLSNASTPAYAQDSEYTLEQLLNQEPEIEEERSSADLTDLPDEYFAEAHQFHTECTTKPHMRANYDCDCLSSRLLDERIEKGPKANRGSLLLGLEGSCKNVVETAGARYTSCMSSYLGLPKDKDPEIYCACVANNYAKLYELTTAKPSSRLTLAIHKRAATSCQNPELAKRLYPEISGIVE